MTATTSAPTATVLPPRDRAAMLGLSEFLDHADGPADLVDREGHAIELPEQATQVLAAVARAMREGKAVTIAPVDQVLTTQEAADFLQVSRPTLVKLLESGRIPFEQSAPRAHRRVRLGDVLAHQGTVRALRRAALDRITQEAADAGLYEDTAEDYTAALAAARRHGH